MRGKPLSPLSGIFQKQRGVRSGLPGVIFRQRPESALILVFVELKSRRGVASEAQKQVGAAAWWIARSARAALTALPRSGVVFRRP
jgi:hypothetical protein